MHTLQPCSGFSNGFAGDETGLSDSPFTATDPRRAGMSPIPGQPAIQLHRTREEARMAYRERLALRAEGWQRQR